MRSRIGWAALGVVLLVGAASTASGQGTRPGRAARTPVYDMATVETVSGTIAKIDTVAATPTTAGGVHLQLSADRGTVEVHLGPTAFLARNAFTLRTGERATVRGSRVEVNGAPALVAAEVTKADGSKLALRNAQGIPLWSRGGPMRRP